MIKSLSVKIPVLSILIMSFIQPNSLNCQAITESLTTQQLLRSKDLTPNEVYDILAGRLQKAKESNDLEQELAQTKAMASASYRAYRTKEIATWQSKVDSLSILVPDASFDRRYMMHKITWAHANKKTAHAMDLLNEIEPHVLASNDTSWMIDYHIKSVKAYCGFDDMAVALRHLLLAEELNDKYKSRSHAGLIFTAKSAIEWEKRNFKFALDYMLQAKDIFEEENSIDNLASVYSDISTLAKKEGDLEKADTYINKLSQLQKERGCQTCYFSTQLNRTFYRIQDGEFHKAIDLAKRLVAYADSTNRDQSHAVYLMGVAYRGLDQYDKAASLINRAFDLATDIEHNGKSSFYSHALYQTFYWKENYAPALKWYQTHIQYRDSVYNEKKLKEISVYESKLKSLEQRRKVEELEAKVEIDRQKKRVLWISLLLGGLLAASLIYLQRQRAKNEKVKQDALLQQSNLQREKLEQQLEFKQKELTAQILNMTQKNTMLQDVKERIKILKDGQNDHAVSRLIRTINRSIDDTDDWDQFLNTFKSIHSSFLSKFQSLADNLTSNEVRLASLMKMNLSSKEIASMLNISDDGVKKARYRLRKKLGLSSEISVQDYILGIG